MRTFSISVDMSELLAAGPLVRAGLFPRLEAAVSQIVDVGVERWKMAAMAAPLWEGERKAYAASIEGRMLSPLSGEITATYKYVEDIERGRPAYDMKRMLDSSLKVRVSKKGLRYLIIPMRHNTPGSEGLAQAMPGAVYQRAKALAPSRIVGQGDRVSQARFLHLSHQPVHVRKNAYKWGGRLDTAHIEGLSATQRRRAQGMVRFSTTTPGGKRYSTYLTFRVLVENSPGWIIRPKPGLWLAQRVAESLQSTAEAAFPAALSGDLAAA